MHRIFDRRFYRLLRNKWTSWYSLRLLDSAGDRSASEENGDESRNTQSNRAGHCGNAAADGVSQHGGL